MRLLFPKKGVSDLLDAGSQSPETTLSAKNVRMRDPVTGRMRGAQRSGQIKHSSTALGGGGTNVSLLAEIVYDNPQSIFTALGDSVTTTWSAATPSVQDSQNCT